MRRARSLSRILFLWAWARSWVKTSGMLSPVRAVSTPRASSMMTRLSSALCSCSARISLRRARARAGSDHPAPAPQPAAEQSRAISHPSDPSAKSQPEPPRLSARALRSIAGQPHVSLAAGPIRPTTALLLNPPPGRGHRWLRSRPWLPVSARCFTSEEEPPRTDLDTDAITINRRPAEVFRFLADFVNVPLWNYAISETRKVTGGPVGVGSRYRQTRTLPEARRPLSTVTEFEPDRRLSIRDALGPLRGEVAYLLAPAGNDTALTNPMNLQPPGSTAVRCATGGFPRQVGGGCEPRHTQADPRRAGGRPDDG